MSDCPCRLREPEAKSYAQCCEPWHKGYLQGIHAPTPEALMRSRYSAYALAKKNDKQGHALLSYLLDTWHGPTKPFELELSPIHWIGLDVLEVQTKAEVGVVEFKAFLRVDGKAQAMHELSQFILVDGAWKYIGGEQL